MDSFLYRHAPMRARWLGRSVVWRMALAVAVLISLAHVCALEPHAVLVPAAHAHDAPVEDEHDGTHLASCEAAVANACQPVLTATLSPEPPLGAAPAAGPTHTAVGGFAADVDRPPLAALRI
jgi:hypothetical protein